MVPIETVKAGDLVWSRDEVSGSEAWRPVVEVFESHPRELARLGYTLGGESEPRELIGTAEHPFWSKDRERWVSMGDLELGERLYVGGDAVEAVVTALVLEIAPAGEAFTTYNFEVAGWHSYFVAPKNSPPGTATIWTHNMCDARLAELIAKIEKAAPHHGERVLDVVRGKIPEAQFSALEAAVNGRKLAPENALPRINVGPAGHHVPAVRKSMGRPFEVGRADKTRPTMHSRGIDPGHDHWRLHDAERAHVGPRQGPFKGTDDQLFDAYRRAYEGFDDIRVDVRSPNGAHALGTDVSPLQAVDLIENWLRQQGLR